MTLDELRAKARWIGRQPYWHLINQTIPEIIRDDVKKNGSKQYMNLLTDVDKSLSTTVNDLIEALHRAGFPSEKITIQDEHKAQIELGGALCTISDSQNDHSFLYDNNNTRKFLDFRHTPADILAAYLVERYCSANWLEEETQRRLVLLEASDKRQQEEDNLRKAYYKIQEKVRDVILSGFLLQIIQQISAHRSSAILLGLQDAQWLYLIYVVDTQIEQLAGMEGESLSCVEQRKAGTSECSKSHIADVLIFYGVSFCGAQQTYSCHNLL